MLRLLVASVALLVAGCFHPPTLVPNPATETPSLARASGAGVTLEVVANAWRGDPTGLPEQLTPLWVHLRNDGDAAYDITYPALQLVDDQGHLFAAVPPLEVVRMVVGSAVSVGPVQVAELDSDVPSIELAQFGFGMGMGMGPDPTWGSSNYPEAANAASAVLGRALREGRLLAKTQAAGFVYFQRAYAAHALTLRVQAPSEVAGNPPLVLETRFTVQP